jgi:MFS family permease
LRRRVSFIYFSQYRDKANTNVSIGPLLSVIVVPLIMEFRVGFTQVTLLSGYQLATVASVSIFVSALSRKFGNRPAFLVSLSLLLAGSIWCGESTSYNSMLGGRIIQGLGTATFESITFAIIGDLYFVHQRGSRMAIYVISQTGLVLMPSMIAGKVAEDLSWRWTFRLLSIFIGIGFLGVILFGWETAFNRNAVYNIDTSSHDVRLFLLVAIILC